MNDQEKQFIKSFFQHTAAHGIEVNVPLTSYWAVNVVPGLASACPANVIETVPGPEVPEL